MRWAEFLRTQKGYQSITWFTQNFQEVYGRSADQASAGEQLYHLKRGTMTAQEYSLKFCTLAAASLWDERALTTTYRQGLEPHLI